MKHGIQSALSIVATLTEDVEGKDLNSIYNEANVQLTLEPSEALEALMERFRFTRRGKLAYARPLRSPEGRRLPHIGKSFILKLVQQFGGGALYDNNVDINDLPSTLVTGTGSRFPYISIFSRGHRGFRRAMINHGFLPDTEELEKATPKELWYAMACCPTTDEVQRDLDSMKPKFPYGVGEVLRADAHEPAYWGWAVRREYAIQATIMLELKRDQLWIRVLPSDSISQLAHLINTPKNGRIKYATNDIILTPFEAYIAVDKVRHLPNGESLFDSRSSEALEFLNKTQNIVAVGYEPNSPTSVRLYKGKNVKAVETAKYVPNTPIKVDVKQAVMLSAQGNIPVYMHPALTDIVNMVNHKPYEGEPRLFEWQKNAVGLHLSTNIGYLQSAETGLGKTAMGLVALREKAKHIDNYRTLIVVPANIREQWIDAFAEWWEDANLFTVKRSLDASRLAEYLKEDKPLAVIVSYEHASTVMDALEAGKKADPNSLGKLLLDTHWHDLIADEAVSIRNGSSNQAKALWELRMNADTAVALTATPINKAVDDLGRLLSWVRKDRNLFRGAPLSEQYATTTIEGAKEMYEAFYPLLFRVDTSVAEDKIPAVKGTALNVTPTPAEKALAYASEKELRRCYVELKEALDQLEVTDASATEIEELKEKVKEAKGAWLGGILLARMAASDARTLLSSDSVGAQLLISQGLVQSALEDEPSKQKALMADLSDRIMRGQQAVVFTDFVGVAQNLKEAIEAYGFRAGVFSGQNGVARERVRRAFLNGDLDVVVLTKAGERGLNLQSASVLYHYDIPWVPDRIIQRNGRVVRLGAASQKTDIIYIMMEDSVEVRMARRIVRTSISSSLVLDNSRGSNVANTPTGQMLAGLLDGYEADETNSETDSEDILNYIQLLNIKTPKKETVSL